MITTIMYRSVPPLAAVLLLTLSLRPDPAAACDTVFRDVQAAVAPLPDVRVWYGAKIERRAEVPACLEWAVDDLNAAVEANGRFVEPGGWSEVLARVAAISSQTEIHYWSAGRGRWRHMLKDSRALLTNDPGAVRDDFLPAELQAGRTLYFRYRANGAEHNVVLRMRILERSGERLVLDLENAKNIPVHPLLNIQPAQTKVAVIVEHEGDGRFRYRSLMALDLELGPFLPYLVEDSLRHRSVAVFRFLAGIPTDREPHAGGA